MFSGMEISPVSLTQIQRGRDGRTYEVAGSAGAVLRDIQELDPRFRANYHEGGDYFTVYAVNEDGAEDIVLQVPAAEWDRRVTEKLRVRAWENRNMVSSAKRLDREHEAKKRDIESRAEGAIGEYAYPLMRSIQKEILGINPKSFRPRKAPK